MDSETDHQNHLPLVKSKYEKINPEKNKKLKNYMCFRLRKCSNFDKRKSSVGDNKLPNLNQRSRNSSIRYV